MYNSSIVERKKEKKIHVVKGGKGIWDVEVEKNFHFISWAVEKASRRTNKKRINKGCDHSEIVQNSKNYLSSLLQILDSAKEKNVYSYLQNEYGMMS